MLVDLLLLQAETFSLIQNGTKLIRISGHLNSASISTHSDGVYNYILQHTLESTNTIISASSISDLCLQYLPIASFPFPSHSISIINYPFQTNFLYITNLSADSLCIHLRGNT
jgi:hypothetical protein